MITKAILLAMIAIESAGNPKALSTSDAKGLLQLTSIAEKEVCQQYGCPKDYDIWNPETNILMGYQLASYYLSEANGDMIGMIVLYNSGYVGHKKYLRGETLAEETRNYIIKFKQMRSFYANCFDRQPSAVFEHSKTIDNVLRRVGAEDGTTLLDIWL